MPACRDRDAGTLTVRPRLIDAPGLGPREHLALDEAYLTLAEFKAAYEQARVTRATIRGFINYLRKYETDRSISMARKGKLPPPAAPSGLLTSNREP